MKNMIKSDYESPSFVSNHPDNQWLKKIVGWTFNGTLSFASRQPAVNHSLVKNFFALYNYHLDGEFNWKNVPVYWKWEADENDRLHIHFVLLAYTPEFNWLEGGEHQFRGANEVADWMRTNWRHGKSEFAGYRNFGWLNYITKDNPVMDSCFTPPIHHLKKKVAKMEDLEKNGKLDAGRKVCFFPWLPWLYPNQLEAAL